jgi:hypothetical protein
MYFEEALFYIFILCLFVVGLVGAAVHAGNKSDQHDEQMRQQISQCNKDHKQWIFTKDYGLDGICVTQK